jgi:hypothetical protein
MRWVGGGEALISGMTTAYRAVYCASSLALVLRRLALGNDCAFDCDFVCSDIWIDCDAVSSGMHWAS